MWHIEVEQEVAEWLERLVPADFDQAAEAIDRLRDAGNRLRMPLSRPLGSGLFELRGDVEAHHVLVRGLAVDLDRAADDLSQAANQ